MHVSGRFWHIEMFRTINIADNKQIISVTLPERRGI